MTTTTNAERLEKYRTKMDAAGFKRLSFYASSELDELLTILKTPQLPNARITAHFAVVHLVVRAMRNGGNYRNMHKIWPYLIDTRY